MQNHGCLIFRGSIIWEAIIAGEHSTPPFFISPWEFNLIQLSLRQIMNIQNYKHAFILIDIAYINVFLRLSQKNMLLQFALSFM